MKLLCTLTRRLKPVTRVSAPSLEESKRTTTLCHSSVFSFCSGLLAPFFFLLLLRLSRLPLVCFSLLLFSFFFLFLFFLFNGASLLPFSLTAAAGVVLNSSHSCCLFARFNWKVLHAGAQCCERPSNRAPVCALCTLVLLSDHLRSFRWNIRLETHFDPSDLTCPIAESSRSSTREIAFQCWGWKKFPIRCVASSTGRMLLNLFNHLRC